MRYTIRSAAWILCIAPLFALGQDAGRGSDTRHEGSPPPEVRNGRPPHGNFARHEHEWAEVQSWMEKHSRNRLNFLQHMPEGRAQRAKQIAIEKYEQIVRAQFPALQVAMTREVEAEDGVFGAMIELKQARTAKDAKAENNAKAKVKGQVQSLFTARLAEKKARIERLQKEVEFQQKNETQLVTRWTEKMLERVDGKAGPDSAEASPDSGPND